MCVGGCRCVCVLGCRCVRMGGGVGVCAVQYEYV